MVAGRGYPLPMNRKAKRRNPYMMYRNSNHKVYMNSGDLRLQRRVLLVVCALLLVLSVVMTVLAVRSNVFRANTERQLTQRMQAAVSSAIDEANRIRSVTSDTSSRLAKVRQYVYLMQQLNDLSIRLHGGESGRLAPSQDFADLIADLDAFEAQIQSATSPTMDIWTSLTEHLTALQQKLAAL